MSCMYFVFTVFIAPLVDVVPSSGGNASFRCLSSSVDSIQWLMNGSATLTNEAIASGNAVVLFEIGVGRLDVINVPLEFNGTSIQCHGLLTSGTNFTTEPAILLLQGKFYAVIVFVTGHTVVCSLASWPVWSIDRIFLLNL